MARVLTRLIGFVIADVVRIPARTRLWNRPFRSRAAARWPEATVLAAVAFAFHATLAGTAHLPYDAEFFHYPLLRAVQGLLSAGTIPAWDAFMYGGTPLLANAQSAWLYPPHLVLDGVLSLLGKPLT